MDDSENSFKNIENKNRKISEDYIFCEEKSFNNKKDTMPSMRSENFSQFEKLNFSLENESIQIEKNNSRKASSSSSNKVI